MMTYPTLERVKGEAIDHLSWEVIPLLHCSGEERVSVNVCVSGVCVVF